ncbi:MAG TPA: nucleoside deaminase [Kineosporiaceae bacterium]|nr:nucleoside deaminase [Kineosporiaceae bacterium]
MPDETTADDTTQPDDELLTEVFALAEQARQAGDHPFGALLAVGGQVLARARNLVITSTDITAHAETMLVREVERLGMLPSLATGTVYASCEPCPMCVGALFWAGARRIVFGLSAAHLAALTTPPGQPASGFTITAAELAATARPVMGVSGPWRQDEAAAAHLDFWQ